MQFTLRQLTYVEAVSRSTSIAQAAQELNISQSSVAAAVDQIEAELGYDLFVRMPAKGIITTPAGTEAIEHIRRFLTQAKHLGSDLRSVDGDPQGTIRIACYITTAPFVLPVMLRDFARIYPNIGITIYEGNIEEIGAMLLEGKVDMACGYWSATPRQQNILPADVTFLPLFAARPYALLSGEDPLAAKPAVSLAELAQRPMIMLDLPRTVDYFTGLFRARNLPLRVAHSARSSDMVQALVASGFGFSIFNTMLPPRVAQEPEIAMRPITDDLEAAHFGIAVLPRLRHPRIVQAFLAHSEQLRDAGAFRRFASQ